MEITPITAEDFARFWPTFRAIVQARETYALDPELTYEQAYRLWCEQPQFSFVARAGDEVLGGYYLKPNAAGPGDHICNCGYMVAAEARGRGVARALCEHSQRVARQAGYRGMQFNAVVASNHAAIRLWRSLGFSIVGTVPDAYRHAREGLVDAHIMYKRLTDEP
ncbi:GNAT family N-acetyltransferase [Halomonas salifodinae]|uniref:GNAT family N-acetyltransferase n=1 Tax=Halomonas salifodinae TaxID=438745 RepID=UPI0033A3274D